MASGIPNASRRMSNDSYASAKSEILLSEDAFNNKHSRELFEAIDELRACGANQDIELPELVIVGDQSVGKSSLLQGLTDIPFPVAGRLCTRFPTRIVSRRTPGQSETTKISIEPKVFSSFGGGQYDQRRKGYEAFSRTVPKMTCAEFKEVVDEATDLMGIKRSIPSETISKEPAQRGERNFSDDVLKVEISGPDRSHFSILDVPGVFQSLTKDLTDEEKDGVRTMVTSYIASKQSVIICIASGTNDLANQAVFDMVSKWDKDGERTVGVITKCDIAQETSQVWFKCDRSSALADTIVGAGPRQEQGEKIPSRMVRERDDREQQFFSAQPWKGLPDERRGTQALKKYLADLLCTRIQQAFPIFLKDIQTLLEAAVVDLKDIATARKTTEEKRSYLTKIAQEFEKRASQSVRGRYDSIAATDMKLRMKVREANDAFALEMRLKGHSVAFIGETTDASANQDLSGAAGNEGGKEAPWDSSNSTKPPLNQPRKSDGGLFARLDTVKDKPTLLVQEQGINEPTQAKQTSNQNPFSQSTQLKQAANGTFGGRNPSSSSMFSTSTPGSGFEALQSQPKQATTGLFSGGNMSNPSLFSTPTQAIPFGAPPSQQKQAASGNLFSSVQTPTPPWSNVPFRTKPTDQSPEIYQWIRDEIKASRGTELQGTLNPDVLPILFHKQARKWRQLSEAHFLTIRSFTTKALTQVLHCVCTDPLTRQRIEPLIRDASHQSMDRGLSKLSSRMDAILNKHLQTSNPAFEHKVSEARRVRFYAALERYRSMQRSRTTLPSTNGITFGNEGGRIDDQLLVIDMRDTASLFAELHISNSQNLQDEVHDTLKAYYEIAREDFVEFVNQHIVEAYLDDPRGPVLFFDPLHIAGLSNQEVECLAAEDEALMKNRASKQEALVRLRRAKDIAGRYTPLILSPSTWRRPLSRSLAKTILQASQCAGGDIGLGRVISKRCFTASSAHYWWPRRKDGEADDKEGPDGDYAQQVDGSPSRDHRPPTTPVEKEGLSKEIHILGAGNLGAFVAHSLAGIPDRPPIILLLRRRQLRYWEESDRSIKITARSITESRKGFGIEILRSSVQKQPPSEESSLPVDLDATNQIQLEDAPSQSGLALWKEEEAATAIVGLSLDGSNPVSESHPSSGSGSAASNANYSSPGAEAGMNEVGLGSRTPQAVNEDTPPQFEGRGSAPDSEGKLDAESDEFIYNLIVAVKAPQTVRALQAVAHRLGRSSTILFLQNGMGVIDDVNENLFPDEKHRPTYIVGVVSHGLYSTKIFSVVHAGEGTMALGVMPRMPMNERRDPEQLAQLAPSARYLLRTMTRTPVFVAIGFPPTDLFQQQLDKLAVNCIINPLTALFDCNNGVLLSNFHFTRIIRLLLAEVSLVLKNLPELKNVPNVNMRFDTQRLERVVFSVANTTAANKSSMLQDLKAGKQTEIDYINGYVVKRGEEMGIHCVMNYMLVHMIKGKRKIAQEQAEFLPFAGVGRER